MRPSPSIFSLIWTRLPKSGLGPGAGQLLGAADPTACAPPLAISIPCPFWLCDNAKSVPEASPGVLVTSAAATCPGAIPGIEGGEGVGAG